jgi:hypothetical protein
MSAAVSAFWLNIPKPAALPETTRRARGVVEHKKLMADKMPL